MRLITPLQPAHSANIKMLPRIYQSRKMVRNYKKKTNRTNISEDDMKIATQAALSGHLPERQCRVILEEELFKLELES
ncbi:tetratricopeptide repeat [Holotrichia oblita]|uniref:Tetratricopeptide repeat n=1 Tax=Holotrichia oblita TaxID=644536 RepID=A0ACB9T6S5_HOLOL|nr:tetratricopeptide repeat [Holotrichia oblita]